MFSFIKIVQLERINQFWARTSLWLNTVATAVMKGSIIDPLYKIFVVVEIYCKMYIPFLM